MKFAINVTSPHIETSLKKGNFRGEPRWERQAAEALIEAGHEVYNMTEGGAWVPSHLQPSNYHTSGSRGPLAKEMVGIAHDFQPNSVPPIYKAQIFNIFSTHYFRDIPEKVIEYKNIYGNRLIYTQGYKDSSIIKDIRAHVAEENYERLPCPSAPYICEEDHFNKKKLVWLSRGIHLHAFPGKENPELIQLIQWVGQKLAADPELEFLMIPGMGPADMEWQGWPGTIEDRIWESSVIQHLTPYRSQVKVIPSCDWEEILEIMKDTKMSISPAPDRWGGPPVEAGMHGIPYVTINGPGIYEHAPGRLPTNSMKERVDWYERLFSDHTLYRQHGDHHREFIRENHTYEAFNRVLLEFLAARGIHD